MRTSQALRRSRSRSLSRRDISIQNLRPFNGIFGTAGHLGKCRPDFVIGTAPLQPTMLELWLILPHPEAALLFAPLIGQLSPSPRKRGEGGRFSARRRGKAAADLVNDNAGKPRQWG